MPLHIGVPVQVALGGLLMWLRPSQPLCAALETATNRPNFRLIAGCLPLLTLMPIGRPELPPSADICTPLIKWLQVGFGFLLTLTVRLCTELGARQRFAHRHTRRLPPKDRQRWLGTTAAVTGCPHAIAIMAYVHILTALWFALLWQSQQDALGGVSPPLAAALEPANVTSQ